LRLQHLLPPSRGVHQLLALHIDVYEKLWELDGAVNDMNSREPKPILLESFTNLMSEIEGRMSTVVVRAVRGVDLCSWRRMIDRRMKEGSLNRPRPVMVYHPSIHQQETLMEGLQESQRAQEGSAPPSQGGVDLPTPIITSQVDRFLQVGKWTDRRKGLRLRWMKSNRRADRQPIEITGAYRHRHARAALPGHQQGPRRGALRPADRAHPGLRLLVPAVRALVDGWTGHATQRRRLTVPALFSFLFLHPTSTPSASGPSSSYVPPSEVNQRWGCIIENAAIKELVEDVRWVPCIHCSPCSHSCVGGGSGGGGGTTGQRTNLTGLFIPSIHRAEVDQLSEHYIADRIPGVKIVDGTSCAPILMPCNATLCHAMQPNESFTSLTSGSHRHCRGRRLLRHAHPRALPPHALRDPQGG